MFENKVKIVMIKGEKGDAGDTGDYSGLTNKPSINGIELDGNKTASDLGIMTQTEADQQRDEIDAFEQSVEETLSNYATQEWVTDELANFPTTTELNLILADYATQAWVTAQIASAITTAISASY